MIINALFDASVAAAPPSFKDGVAAAIQILQANLGSNITVNVHFGWGEVNDTAIPTTDVGRSFAHGGYYTYDQVRTALVASATSLADLQSTAALPATYPNKNGTFFLTDAQLATLGLGTPATIDGYVGLNASKPYTFDPNHRAEAGKYDGIGMLLQCLTEVLGRFGSLGADLGGQTNVWTPLDLFRFTTPGGRDYTGDGSFSADGGVTLLTKFNTPGASSGDPGDWTQTLTGDAYGVSTPGIASMLTATDLKVMDVLGYTLTAVTGTTGDDSLSGTSFNETYDGRGGIDTVTFRGNHLSYTISGTYPSLTVADSVANRDGTDTLTSIEHLKFTDIGLVFGLDSAQDQIVYRLYQAAFARVPDFAGFKAWATYADATHVSALTLAQTFVNSGEFAGLYGGLGDAAYVGALYANVLGRPADDAGLAYWLSKGESRAQLLADFAGSAENVQLTANHMVNGYWVL